MYLAQIQLSFRKINIRSITLHIALVNPCSLSPISKAIYLTTPFKHVVTTMSERKRVKLKTKTGLF